MCFLGQHGSELRFNVDDAEIGKALIHAACQDAVVCVKSSQQVTGGTVDAADQADVLRDDDVAVSQAADENFTSIAKVCRTLQSGPEHSIWALWLVGEEVICFPQHLKVPCLFVRLALVAQKINSHTRDPL